MTNYEKIGLDYIFENLDIVSSLGKKQLKNLQFLKNSEIIENEYRNIEKFSKVLEEQNRLKQELKRKLKPFKDITNVVKRLKDGYILDDVELFQIKIFSMDSQNIYHILEEIHPEIAPKNLKRVVSLLDPDKTGIASFHIYSSYSPELYSVREELKVEKSEALLEKESYLEEKIRGELSKKLLMFSEQLLDSIDKIGYIDFTLSKIEQNKNLNLVKPKIGDFTKYEGIFNPKVLNHLKEKNREYQKIDIDLGKGISVITGANMSGKTLTLKNLALSQYLCQLGFYVPAFSATIKIVEKIHLVMGDFQSIESGLSSFAGEMLLVNNIVKEAKNGENILVLIDELARTTNPQEGQAIVKSVIGILKDKKIIGVVTTHYDKIGNNVNRLRVKGLKENDLPKNITEKNIEEFIDYSLIKDEIDKVPEEALTIGKLLGIDDEIIDRAYFYLKGEKVE